MYAFSRSQPRITSYMWDASKTLDHEKPDTGRITEVSKTRDNRQLPRQHKNAFRNKIADEKIKRIEAMLLSPKNKAITINPKVQTEKVKETKFPVERESKCRFKPH